MKTLVNNGKESMRGLFSICMGQFSGNFPTDFDPTLDSTKQWYQLFDTCTYFVVACGTLDMCLKSLEKQLKRYKSREEYFKHLWEFSTEDYYLVHYKHHTPLTTEQRTKLLGSKCCGTPQNEKDRKAEVHDKYGYYFHDMIKEVEDKVFNNMEKTRRPLLKSKKVIKTLKQSPKKETVVPTTDSTPKKKLHKLNKPKARKITLLK